MSRAIMVLGTASHVGKSLLTAAICRILADDGLRVAPFKAQNMSLNSAPAADGSEIGRAQAMQAEAARVAPSVNMNPVLLKPTSDRGSQVVVLGKVYGFQTARDYHLGKVHELFPLVVEAYRSLASAYDVVVLEGAGSPAEINLREHDIVNMRMAEAADAACVLVGDIDRGGVFASLYGTMALLESHERARIAGFAINKFRGDPSLLMPGVADFEKRLGLPSFGVVPWLRDVGLDEEDGVSEAEIPRVARRGWSAPAADASRRLRVAVVAFPYISNFTDFAALSAEPSVDLAYAERPADLECADVVILPGTKDTMNVLRWLRDGMGDAIAAFARTRPVLGICGGYQVLGRAVADPHGVEGGGTERGLGLLAIDTVLEREKTVRNARVTPRALAFFGCGPAADDITGEDAYEIHMGVTARDAGIEPFARMERAGTDADDGARSADGNVVGTYAHGLFASDALRWAFVRAARARAALAPPHDLVAYGAQRDARFDRLAAHVRASLDVRALLAAAAR